MAEIFSSISHDTPGEDNSDATNMKFNTIETGESMPESKDVEHAYEWHELHALHTPKTSQLPIELWKDIIEYATYLPGELGIAEEDKDRPYDNSDIDSGNDLAFGRVDLFTTKDRTCPQTCPEEALQTQLRIRHNLTLVSRFWYNLVAPSFYRTLYIRRASQLRALLDRIALDLEVKDSEDARFGRFVRRIDIHVGGDRENVLRHLSSLLYFSPNVVIYTGVVFPAPEEAATNALHSVEPRIVDRSQSRHSSTSLLRYLHLGRADGVINSHQQLSEQLSAFTYLRTLSIAKVIPNLTIISPQDSIHSHPTPHGSLILPSLEIISITTSSDAALFVNRDLVTFDLPRLHSLQLEIVSQTPLPLLPFLKKYGHQITTMRITDTRRVEMVSFNVQFPGLKQEIMPNLRQLITNCGVNDELMRGLAGVPRLGGPAGATPNAAVGVGVGSAGGGVTVFKSIEVFEVQFPLRNRFLDSDELHVMRLGHDLALGDVLQRFKGLKTLRVSTSSLAPPVVGPVTVCIPKCTLLLPPSTSASSCSSSEVGSSSGSIPASPAINPCTLLDATSNIHSSATSSSSASHSQTSISREAESMMKIRYLVNDHLQKFIDLLEKSSVELDNRLFC